MPDDETPLVLNHEQLEERSMAFFQRLNTDATLRERLVNDPVGTIEEEVYGHNLDAREISINQANRLLFSLLSNPQFMSRIEELNGIMGPQTTNTEIHSAIVQAIIDYGDSEVVAALTPAHPAEVLASDVAVQRTMNELFCVLDCSPVVINQVIVAGRALDQLTRVMTREDVARVVRLFSEAVPSRGADLRQSGVLRAQRTVREGRILHSDNR